MTPAQIDVVNTFPLGSLVPVMDELKDIEYKIDDYSIVRSAIATMIGKEFCTLCIYTLIEF